jgi:aryl-alcohol dehydrogenase-like predicted oxidoreductase
MDRRAFIAAAATVPSALGKQAIPRRAYNKDVQLSIVGLGGIVLVGQEQSAANRIVAASFDRGVNYYDVAPSYWDGEAELKLGEALRPYRKRVFLACKTERRDAEGAREELERSLKRLETDYFDLYQFHAISSVKDVDEIIRPGGAGDLFLKARDEGKVRYLGVSAHSAEAAIKLMDNYPLDSILFPVSFNTWAKGKFGPQILDFAKQKRIARLGLKAMALGPWPKGTDRNKTKYPKCWYQPIDEPVLAGKALRWALSQDITAAIPPGEASLYETALRIATNFRPMKEREQDALLSAPSAADALFNA